jgi:Na+/H+ antiporter NhaD/arsenite permease-like protein
VTELSVLVFLGTYAGMAIGRVPGLRLDRTGIALIALAILLGSGTLSLADLGRHVDWPTVVLLFALMIVSAQFAGSGFYDRCAGRIAVSGASPARLVGLVLVTAAALSALLANDVVVFALTPLLCRGARQRGLDPRPLLVALAVGSNLGSAATVIGNPQNILIGQVGDLDFWRFLAVCGPPALGALAVAHAVIVRVWRPQLSTPAMPATPGDSAPTALDRGQAAKGAAALVVLVVVFTGDLPRAIGALAVAAVLLASRRMASRDMLGAVDWHLLLLFVCLFGVTGVFATTEEAAAGITWIAERGFAPDNLAVLAPLSLVLSNTVGNVPAVVLITTLWPGLPAGALYALALLSTLAGNLLLVGSIANLIVAERAARSGVSLGFADFARAGVPLTVATMVLAVSWLWLTGVVPAG